MKQQVIDLWKTSFGDPDDFIRLYFDQVYKDENTLTLCENGRVISALQIHPYEMSYCGTTVPAAYVCGVCTLPSERGKGRMNRLMRRALDVMRDRRYALSVLIPASGWLFDYYARFGYAKAFDYSLETHHTTVIPGASSCRIVTHENISPEALYAYYNRKQRQRSCAVLHTAQDWNFILQDCLMSGGNVCVALQDEAPAGMALALPTDENGVYIREILYGQPGVKDALIQYILTRSGRQTAQVRTAATPSTACPYGMACLLDKQRMTDLYRSFHRLADTSFPGDTNPQTLVQTLLRQGWMNLMLD
jgi:predicted acetyltransferase